MPVKELTRHQKEMVEMWQKRIPPARPSAEMVAIYKKGIAAGIRHNQGARLGLLGCTPEIRSLAAEYQAEITCMDRDRDAFHAYKTICTPSKYEYFHCSDWLELDLPAGFDAVLGDGAMSMLPREKHGLFLKNIYNIMKDSALALLRIHVLGPSVFKNEQQVFDWYRQTQADKPMYYMTRPFLYALWLNPENMRVSKAEFKERVREFHACGVLSAAEYRQFDEIENSNVEVQYTTKAEFEELLSPYFDIEDVQYAGDYLISKNHPVYILRKKRLCQERLRFLDTTPKSLWSPKEHVCHIEAKLEQFVN